MHGKAVLVWCDGCTGVCVLVPCSCARGANGFAHTGHHVYEVRVVRTIAAVVSMGW